jgi:hypothetical protein
MTVSVHTMKAKIVRVVRRGQRHPEAEFFHVREGGNWLCAHAWLSDSGPQIQPRSGGLTLEETAVVITALQLAVDWIVEECQRREDFGPNGDATTPGFIQ